MATTVTSRRSECSERCWNSKASSSTCKCKCGGASHGGGSHLVPAASQDGLVIRALPARPSAPPPRVPGAISDREVVDLFGGEQLVVHSPDAQAAHTGIVVGTGYDYRDPAAPDGGGWGPVAVVLGEDDRLRIADSGRLTRAPYSTPSMRVGQSTEDGAVVEQDPDGQPILSYQQGRMTANQIRRMNTRIEAIARQATEELGDSYTTDDPLARDVEERRYVAAMKHCLSRGCDSFTAGAAAGLRLGSTAGTHLAAATETHLPVAA